MPGPLSWSRVDPVAAATYGAVLCMAKSMLNGGNYDGVEP